MNPHPLHHMQTRHNRVVTRKLVLCLGISQLISWGVSYYLIGGFGQAIATELGWSQRVVYGGFALALMVMGLASTLAGRLIDRHGGRFVMTAGSLFNALGCASLAFCHALPVYWFAWICLGVGMRLTLYDAAFAALARIGGPQARTAMSQITLLGGLASTAFWPLGNLLTVEFGWRNALLFYCIFALLTIPLHLAIPANRHGHNGSALPAKPAAPRASSRSELILAGCLYALINAFTNFLNAGMSAHMIGILAGLGLVASASVWIATLRGVGQSLARLCEIAFGKRIDPSTLTLAACAMMPLPFLAGLYSGTSMTAAFAFAFLYGACNGILTITRGTLALDLFDHRTYGTFVGRLIAPSFMLSAAAPVIYASVIAQFGEKSGLYLSVALAVLMLIAALLLKLRFGKARR